MNPILQKIQDGIEQHIKPEYKDGYTRMVLGGMKILNDPKTHANMELVKNPAAREEPVETISNGVAGLMWIIYRESIRNVDPNRPLKPGEIMVGLIPDVFINAGLTLMCKVFDIAERGLGMNITNDIIAETTKQLSYRLMARLGISKDDLNKQIEAGAQEIKQHQSSQAGGV